MSGELTLKKTLTPIPSPKMATVYTHLGYVTTASLSPPQGEKEVLPTSWKIGITGICV
jgi:hypothetical protein